MTDDFSDFDGIGPTLNERLHENGYETYEDLADADTDELQEIKGVTEDRALSAVVAAGDVVEVEEAVEEDDTDDFVTTDDIGSEEEEGDDVDGDGVNGGGEGVADEGEGEDTSEPETFELELDLDDREHQVLTSALLDSYTSLQRRNRSRAAAADRVLDGVYSEEDVLELTQDELNALYAALHQRVQRYKGDNHVDLMNVARGIEEEVNEVRDEMF